MEVTYKHQNAISRMCEDIDHFNKPAPAWQIELSRGKAYTLVMITNRNPYMGHPAAPLDLILSNLKRSK